MLALLVQGCTGFSLGLSAPSRSELNSVLQAPPDVVVPELDMLVLTPEMKQFVHDTVPRMGSETRRIDSLIYALRHPGVLKIDYDGGANLGAPQVFEQRRANCLSFAALFITLAREAGFNAYFQKVDVDAQWERLDNDLLLRLQHVNTVVEGAGNQEHIIEFQRDRFNMLMPREPVSDAYGLGLFYNNLGGEFLFNGDLKTARAYLLRALEADPSIPAAWVNMGVAHRRENRTALAEISYRQALHVDPENTVAMNNLASLLELRGETALAAKLKERASNQRLKNPHYHYAMAKHAYEQKHFEEARTHLDAAMKRGRREHNFHHLMALILHALGDTEQAEKSLRMAEKKATDAKDKNQYRATLAAWESPPQGT